MSYTPTEWESTDVVTATRMNTLEQAVGDMNMSYTPNTWSDGDILSAEKMNALEQAVASGGGGSSDFTTAEVTIINDSNNDNLSFYGSVCLEADALGEGSPAMAYPYMMLPKSDTVTFNVALYKGTACLLFDDLSAISITGDIVEMFGMLIVTGDCTITIS